MIEPIKANQRASVGPEGAVPEQKVFTQQDIPRSVVTRKQGVSSAREEVPREEVEETTAKLNRMMGIIDKRFKFKVHEKTGQLMVDIIDQGTGRVLDEIPPKKLLDFFASFQELAGMLVDKRV